MAKWAVFDIDGTLLPSPSLEVRFFSTLRKRIKVPSRNMIHYFLKGIKNILKGDKEDAFKINKMYLKDIPSQSIKEIAWDFHNKEILPILSSKGLKTIEYLRTENYKIMLMSGSLDVLLENIKGVCKPDYMVSCKLEIDQLTGKYTGQIVGAHPYGLRKKQILLDLQKKLEIDFEHSIVFADHHSDISHMELFGEVVAVNPTLLLNGIAQTRGWKVEVWK